MKTATMKEVEEIRLIAEQKLSNYKERVSNEDYKTILVMTTHEIAHDMELEIVDDQTIITDNFHKKL